MITVTKPQPKPPQARKPEPHAVQLATLRRLLATKATVTVTGLFGNRYQGAIVAFDTYTIRLDNGVMLFKHSIESISEQIPEKDTQ